MRRREFLKRVAALCCLPLAAEPVRKAALGLWKSSLASTNEMGGFVVPVQYMRALEKMLRQKGFIVGGPIPVPQGFMQMKREWKKEDGVRMGEFLKLVAKGSA